MNYSFEYIDIILLAMIVGFIFLRLRGILGRRNGNEETFPGHMAQKFQQKTNFKKFDKYVFDDDEKQKFIKGAKLAYETIITSFGKGELSQLKHLLDKDIYKNFSDAIKERKEKKIKSETTFIGIKSAKIKDYTEKDNIYTVTVDFISEIITYSKNNENQIISGDPEKIKVVSDTWKFLKDQKKNSPIWLLIQTQE
ncbi:MAG: Tim44/TimA family putative adaptor protein [Candidatus Pelagibacter sp.]|nr:MAG: Tim44 domain-containing protein [Pelagibacteraceae bacterium TMED233]|tara:strand:- start:48 stop:635 length:588 start_codon:yes stop_codon:yes gene_type:complete